MELDKLKAQAYDCLAQIQSLQNTLATVNQKIANFKPEEVKPVEEVKPEEPKK